MWHGFTSGDLKRLLEGDVTLVERALALPSTELAGLWRELEGFVLRREHVLRVLKALRTASITRQQANGWGSFIFTDGSQWVPVETPEWVRSDDDVMRFATDRAREHDDEEPAKPIDVPYQAEYES